MRKVQAAILFLSVTIGTMSFQNCSTYQPNETLDSASVAPIRLCTGMDCIVAPEAIQLSIGNVPIMLFQTGSRKETAVDIAGYCDPGGYPDNAISWRLRDLGTNADVATGAGKCDSLGRYILSVGIPGNYNYANRHLLYVTLVGKDQSGLSVPSTGGGVKSLYFDTVQTP